MKPNKDWHISHPMPQNPTMEERLEWHIEHAKYCQCREIPTALKVEIKKRNSKVK